MGRTRSGLGALLVAVLIGISAANNQFVQPLAFLAIALAAIWALLECQDRLAKGHNRRVSLFWCLGIGVAFGVFAGWLVWLTWPPLPVVTLAKTEGPPPQTKAVPTVQPPKTDPVPEKPKEPNVAQQKKTSQSSSGPNSPNINQQSTGPNSPNILTLGPNSPVVINPPRPQWLLSEEVGNSLVAVLKTLPILDPGQADMVMANMGDPESGRLAEQFAAVFQSAGWPNIRGISQGMGSGVFEGLAINVHSEDSVPPHVEAIAKVLISAGFVSKPMAVGIVLGIPKGMFQVRVGARPR